MGGLVPWSVIGKAVGVETAVIDSIINLYNVIHERDWREHGRSSGDLGLDGLSVDQIVDYVGTGNRAHNEADPRDAVAPTC
jgi:opine dehydrogenase